MEETIKALHAAGFLVQSLRDMSKKSNTDDNRALHILTRNLLEMAIKVEQTLTELV